MIHEIAGELQAKLKANGCPFVVVDGPERTDDTTWGRERIVLEHDDGSADAYGPIKGVHKNPKHRFTRTMAVKATIHAQCPTTGALEWEHRRRAEHVLDILLVALDDVAKTRRNAWSPTGGKFIDPADLEKTPVAAGAVYQLSFRFDRAVMMRTWAGAARPEGTLAGGLKNTTKVSLAHGPDDGDPTQVPATAETSCGS